MINFENFTTPKSESNKEEKRAELMDLATEMINENRVYPWPGLTPDAYSRFRSEEEEFPGFCNPIDDVVKRCEVEGIKIVFISKTIAVIPAETGDIDMDIIFPHSLQVRSYSDGQLSELIAVSKQLK